MRCWAMLLLSQRAGRPAWPFCHQGRPAALPAPPGSARERPFPQEVKFLRHRGSIGHFSRRRWNVALRVLSLAGKAGRDSGAWELPDDF
jgi:hypothetical protein